jgi:hypothetical protein
VPDITGARGTGNITQSIRRVDMKEQVLELEPNSVPLTVLSSKLGTEGTHNPEFSWVEDRLENRYDAINNGGGYSNSATSIVVDDGTKFAQHDLVKVTRTGELFRVTAVATNTLTVVRGIATGGTGVAMLDNDELVVVGSAQPEGDTSKAARSSNPVKVTNYTQILRKSFESTETLRHSDTFTKPNDWPRQASHAGIEHAKDLELTFWHGKPSEDLTGSQPRRTTGGVFHYVTTNVTNAGGTLTEQEFFAGFSTLFRYGNQRVKSAFASRLAVDVVNGFPRGKLEVSQADKDQTFGLNVMKYISPHGELNFMTHNLLEGNVFGGVIAILDMSLIKKRPLSNSEGSRDTAIYTDRQAPDADTKKSEYITEAGLEFGLEKAHGYFTGITS